MKLLVKRLYKKPEYTIGKLYVDGRYFCDTIEDTDRDLSQIMSQQAIALKKQYGKTAIPTGVYKVVLSFSDKFRKTLPLLKDVPEFSGVRIHSGNTERDSLGCVIVGENKAKGMVLNSRATMERLMAKLRGQTDIEIEII